MKINPPPDFESINRYLRYDSESGNLHWRFSTNNRIKKDQVAGTLGSYGYIKIKVVSRVLGAHRLAWLLHYGYWPINDLDHIDRNRVNNKIDNLRNSTRKQNNMNKGMYASNTSGINGVHWCKIKKKWKAKISGKHIGIFSSKFEAAAVRISAQNKMGFNENHGRNI